MRQKFEISHAIRVPSTIDHHTQRRVESVRYVKPPNVAVFKSTRSCKATENTQISAVFGPGTRDDEPTISDIFKMDSFVFRFD